MASIWHFYNVNVENKTNIKIVATKEHRKHLVIVNISCDVSVVFHVSLVLICQILYALKILRMIIGNITQCLADSVTIHFYDT